jgi:hypothetical protein
VRGRRWLVVVTVAVVAAVAATVAIRALLHQVTAISPSCRVGSDGSALTLDPEQAANASTVTAVAARMGLPDHAVTIALATALQESKLHNLPFGDRDSLGLFQQRPSQGWGNRRQLLRPAYAAKAFLSHLVNVDGWEQLPLAQAAQAVQHSADGAGYSAWEEEARALARSLTGEVTGVFSCAFTDATAPLGSKLRALAGRELGPAVLTRSGASTQQDWTVAQWLVAHAYQYGVASVTVRGMRWTHDAFGWRHDAGAGTHPGYRLSPPPRS